MTAKESTELNAKDIEAVDRLNRIVSTLGHRGSDGRGAWEDPASGRIYREVDLWVVRPERRSLGPMEFDGVRDPATDPLVGWTMEEVEKKFYVRIVGMRSDDGLRLAPGGLARDVKIPARASLAVMAARDRLETLVHANQLSRFPHLKYFAEVLAQTRAGIAEVVIPPGSSLIGKSCRDVWMRKTYGLSTLAIHRQGQTIRQGEGVRDLPLQAGDTLVVHTSWSALQRIEKDKNFVVVTTEYPREEQRPQKVGWAALFFIIALSLVLFTDIRLSVALLTGASRCLSLMKRARIYQEALWTLGKGEVDFPLVEIEMAFVMKERLADASSPSLSWLMPR